MPLFTGPFPLAPSGSTGNNVHASIPVPSPDTDSLGFLFVVEAVGATPTVTWKVQGSLAAAGTSDANAAWFDVPYVTDAAAAESAATRTATAVGAQAAWLALPQTRFFQRYRAVVTLNTNVTYRVELYTADRD